MPALRLGIQGSLPGASGLGSTFTRFVLPFAYCPQRHRGLAPDAAYRVTSAGHHDERRGYLTPETADTLFERARWLELDAPGETREHVFGRPGAPGLTSAAVYQAPPRLILFEWARGARASDADGDDQEARSDLLRSGFLILDVVFSGEGDATPPLTHLLQFNEHFRWWRRPFEGYGARGYLQLFGLPASDDHHRTYFERWARHLTHPLRDSDGTLWQLMPADWYAAAERYVDEPGQGTSPPACGWIAYPDPRAFVWTCASLEGGVAAFPGPPVSRDALPGDWVRLLNVDPPGDYALSAFERRWAAERTYDRWMHTGTLYGVCAHAGALLTPPLDEPPVARHFAEMYFDQTLLLLYLRVSTFRFSRELSAISSRARDAGRGATEQLEREFQRLRWSFALLTNLYRFPLLSHQQQGIELYTLARRHFDIEELFQEIQSEVQATDEFLGSARQLDHARMATLLTVVATLALAIALGLDFLQVPAVDWSLLRNGARLAAAGITALAFLALLLAGLSFAHPLARWMHRVADAWRRARTRVEAGASRGSRDR